MHADDLDSALALLARGLQGAIDVAGIDTLPRPHFAAAPPSTTTTTTTTPTTSTTSTTSTTPSTLPAPSTLPTSTLPAPSTSLAAVLTATTPNSERLRVLCDDVIGNCTRCKLHRGRNKLVFGAGNPHASLVFVGEGPGADEDREGIPFVGRAGQLLTKMIGAMKLSRDDVYICNVVKCRPPNNRDPEADEVEACEGFLKAQLSILRPRVIVGLGRHAVHTLLRTQTPISKLRGTWHRYEGIDLMPTYHPSYLLREERDPQQTKKREAWSDLQLVMKKLAET
jgi:uracil-DNA glycosylase family 4